MPGEEDRLRIWRNIWPAEAPIDSEVDLEFMARRFEVTDTAFLDGVLLRRGDLLEPEQSTPATTRAAAAILATRLPAAPGGRTIALFHLSEKSLAGYETSDLDRVFVSLP